MGKVFPTTAQGMVLCMALAFAPAVAAEAPTDTAEAVSTLDQAAWLAGRWVGTGMDGEVEEVWSPASGGQMIGHFRYSKNDVLGFYEIMMIDVTDAGLRMRVKHFNPDFTAWEDKAEWVAFDPVSTSADQLVFSGLVLDRDRDDSGEIMTATLRMRQKDGAVVQVPFRFRRAD